MLARDPAIGEVVVATGESSGDYALLEDMFHPTGRHRVLAQIEIVEIAPGNKRKRFDAEPKTKVDPDALAAVG